MNADHIGRECTEIVNDKPLTFARCTRAVHTAFAEFARTLLPNPVDAVMANLDKLALKDAAVLRKLQTDDQAEIVKAKAEGREPVLLATQFKPFADVLTEQAVNKAATYLGFGSPEVTSVLKSSEGTSYMLYLLLRDHHPEMTPDAAFDVLSALGARTGKIIAVCSGKEEAVPKNVAAPAA